ncbi:MAG: hypothetical protein WCA51_02810 [Dehalococcoidia bacterium]
MTAQDISRQPKLTAGTVEQLADITTLTDPLVVDVLVKEMMWVYFWPKVQSDVYYLWAYLKSY